jgi:hypothetical protein
MFGMLDYRAHKLYRLLSFPIVICGRIAFLIAVAIAIWIAVQFDYWFLARFAIAYVSMEIIASLFALLYWLTVWIFNAIFFWVIDVVPSKGANADEAREIVKKGRVVWLALKLEREIQNWTYDDTLAFVSALNWRARWFFDARRRFEKRLSRLWDYHDETGIQPGELSQSEVQEIAGDQPGWFEIMVVHPHFFNSLIGAAIILVALAYNR